MGMNRTEAMDIIVRAATMQLPVIDNEPGSLLSKINC
jgi:hypothetical protein